MFYPGFLIVNAYLRHKTHLLSIMMAFGNFGRSYPQKSTKFRCQTHQNYHKIQ